MTAVQEQVTDPDIAVFADAANAAGPMPAIPAMAAVWEPLGKAYAAIVAGGRPDHDDRRHAGKTINDSDRRSRRLTVRADRTGDVSASPVRSTRTTQARPVPPAPPPTTAQRSRPVTQADIPADMATEQALAAASASQNPTTTGLFATSTGARRRAGPSSSRCLFLGIGHRRRHRPHPDAGRPGEAGCFLVAVWAIAAVLIGHLRHPPRAARQVPGPGHADAGAVRGLPDRADRADVVHELRRRHPHHQGGDGRQIVGSSVVQTEDAPRYNLTVATDGLGHRPARSPSSWSARTTEHALLGTEDGLEEPTEATSRSRATGSPRPTGYTILDAQQVNDAGAASAGVHRADRGRRDPPARHQRRPSRARTMLEYDEAADTITDTTPARSTPSSSRATGSSSSTRTATGSPTSPGRPTSASPTTRRSSPTHGSAATSSASSSGPSSSPPVGGRRPSCSGCCFAFTLNDPRVRGQKVYRALLHHAVRHPRVHLAAGVVQLLQPGLRPHQRHHRAERQLVRRAAGAPRSPCCSPTCGWASPTCSWSRTGALQAIPADLQRGGQDRRRQRLHRLPQDHLPAAAGERGPAAGGVVRLQLQQLQRDLPAHRGRTVQRRTTRPPAAPTS